MLRSFEGLVLNHTVDGSHQLRTAVYWMARGLN